MKAFRSLTVVALSILLAFSNSKAQNSANLQTYQVHEDVVLPSMVGEYEAVAKELIDAAKKYNIPGMSWILTQTNNMRYLYVSPIANMADLDNTTFWDTLRVKMGAEKFSDLFSKMNKCYDRHFNYTLLLDKDLSYMPGGITQTPSGQDYRRFYYMYSTPQNAAKLAESLKAVKDLFQKKGSKMEYRIYRSGYGAGETYYMVAIAAKDGIDYETMDAANNKLLGADGDKVFMDMMKNVSRLDEVTGRMRPDLAYTPK